MHQSFNTNVFLNVPFDDAYEDLFLAIITSLAALELIPRSVLEIPATGTGRLKRLVKVIKSCRFSLHDLSRTALPARFNMPFELGLAYAFAQLDKRYSLIIFEAKKFRLTRTCSDLNGIDPAIHGNSDRGAISCVLNSFSRSGNYPRAEEVYKSYLLVKQSVKSFKKAAKRKNIFSRNLFLQTVQIATDICSRDLGK